ncbi:MAG: hydroxyacid dehydrogenase [Gammaproteobacteria bacterium]|nr:hydroxyacid dehydrogenase [Gammaproteobacteria bacterium]
MAEIVISEFMDEDAIRGILAGRDVLYDPKLVDRPVDLLQAVRSARALIVRNRTQVRGPLLDAAAHLEVVGRLGVGLDNIDMAACEARRIAVFPATGANDSSVAEYVITAILVLLRRAWFATPEVVAGKWPRMTTIGREIAGKTLGLVGLGNIARETATRARALGMQVVAFDPLLPADHPAWQLAAPVTLEALLARADAVSLHVPLTPATRQMISAPQLAAMRRGSLLINAARGGVVDEAAVVAALRSGQLGGAALDVFDSEPLDAAVGGRFADVPNLLLTPHIAGVTEESNVRVSELTARNVLGQLTRTAPGGQPR